MAWEIYHWKNETFAWNGLAFDHRKSMEKNSKSKVKKGGMNVINFCIFMPPPLGLENPPVNGLSIKSCMFFVGCLCAKNPKEISKKPSSHHSINFKKL